MHWFLLLSLLALRASASVIGAIPEQELSLDDMARRYTKRTAGGVHLPIVKRTSTNLERRAASSAIGLGDFVDVSYTVLMTIGGITTSLILDSGSSDLWVLSDACTQGCTGGVPVYPQASFKYSGVDVSLLYGDSRTGTYADGTIGDDTVSLAGISLQSQYFGSMNRTNTSVLETGAAGIFGLGFPINSVIWNNLFVAETPKNNFGKKRDEEATLSKPHSKFGSPFPNLNFRTTTFPTVPGLMGGPTSGPVARQTTSSILYAAFASWSTMGPFLPRLAATSGLSQPMFSVTLQRDTVDVGGLLGQLSIGELPDGITSDKLTWVPLRLYTSVEGGLPAPPNSPAEVYPITWEVMVEGVYLDGELLPQSAISSPNIGLSALIDTGNSLIRGPSDVVSLITSKLGAKGLFPCNQPHTLAFKIGGNMFPVDPRDFATQALQDNVQTCAPNLAATDPPKVGGYQFGWSLGTPFLKGVLSSYYFGNLTYPSRDPPKMGFLSTVPSDAGDRMKAAVAAAAKADNNFPAISEPAPSGTSARAQTDSNGIPQATGTGSMTRTNSGALHLGPLRPAWTSLVAGVLMVSLMFMRTWI
ncbi:hypothetical protein GALMADRAFT_243260 [Galerina marginata CBS 339.88]|uniref:Peptidase A1 domain-containing protein n=1 Tax=Galerina marginata (strain CBS 339.88) TaxID=685588 RepID=A0A067TK05_GALM3|nr:hypothetical protein GALMADRAFT_243260 [Galerina marginata CBS 339.88]